MYKTFEQNQEEMLIKHFLNNESNLINDEKYKTSHFNFNEIVRKDGKGNTNGKEKK
jgi:hypothetical protein